MKEKYEELKLDVIAFDKDIWTDAADGVEGDSSVVEREEQLPAEMMK